MPPEIDNEISARELREAIHRLRTVLGNTFVNVIIYDLELYGLLPENQTESFTLEQVHIAFERIFGSSAPVLMRLIMKALYEKRAWLTRFNLCLNNFLEFAAFCKCRISTYNAIYHMNKK